MPTPQHTSSRRKSLVSLTLRKTRSSARRQQNIVTEVYPEMDLDRGLVGWEGQEDGLHPRLVLPCFSFFCQLGECCVWERMESGG
jgi:hypothetical protein